jgi:hypothetical protein
MLRSASQVAPHDPSETTCDRAINCENHRPRKWQTLASPDAPKTPRSLPRHRIDFLGHVFRRIGSGTTEHGTERLWYSAAESFRMLRAVERRFRRKRFYPGRLGGISDKRERFNAPPAALQPPPLSLRTTSLALQAPAVSLRIPPVSLQAHGKDRKPPRGSSKGHGRHSRSHS